MQNRTLAFVAGALLGAVLLSVGISWAANRVESTTTAAGVSVYAGRGTGTAETFAGRSLDGGGFLPQVELSTGTASAPLRTDPTGTTTQPVQGECAGQTEGCLQVFCSTVGDGGVLTATTGARYVSTVTSDTAIRVSNGHD